METRPEKILAAVRRPGSRRGGRIDLARRPATLSDIERSRDPAEAPQSRSGRNHVHEPACRIQDPAAAPKRAHRYLRGDLDGQSFAVREGTGYRSICKHYAYPDPD